MHGRDLPILRYLILLHIVSFVRGLVFAESCNRGGLLAAVTASGMRFAFARPQSHSRFRQILGLVGTRLSILSTTHVVLQRFDAFSTYSGERTFPFLDC